MYAEISDPRCLSQGKINNLLWINKHIQLHLKEMITNEDLHEQEGESPISVEDLQDRCWRLQPFSWSCKGCTNPRKSKIVSRSWFLISIHCLHDRKYRMLLKASTSHWSSMEILVEFWHQACIRFVYVKMIIKCLFISSFRVIQILK